MFDIPNTGIILSIVAVLGFGILLVAITIGIILWIRKSYGSGQLKNGVSAPATILRIWDTGTTTLLLMKILWWDFNCR